MPASQVLAASSSSMAETKSAKATEPLPGSFASAMPGGAVLSPASAMAAVSEAKEPGPCPKADGDPRKPKRQRITKAQQAAEEGCEEDSKAPESGTWLIVAKAVRQYLKNNETAMHCGADALPALNAKLADLLRDAMQRAQQNGRKTLKGCDF